MKTLTCIHEASLMSILSIYNYIQKCQERLPEASEEVDANDERDIQEQGNEEASSR